MCSNTGRKHGHLLCRDHPNSSLMQQTPLLGAGVQTLVFMAPKTWTYSDEPWEVPEIRGTVLSQSLPEGPLSQCKPAPCPPVYPPPSQDLQSPLYHQGALDAHQDTQLNPNPRGTYPSTPGFQIRTRVSLSRLLLAFSFSRKVLRAELVFGVEQLSR